MFLARLWLTVQSLGSSGAGGAVGVALVAVVVLMAGCGGGLGVTGTSMEPAPTASVTTVTGAGPTTPAEDGEATPVVSTGTAGTQGALPDDWVAPSDEVLAAFTSASGLVDCPVYAPTRLPPGSRLADTAAAQQSLGDADAQLVLRLQTSLGLIEVAQGIAGDVGDLPAEPSGAVEGHPAVMYRLLGGRLIQLSLIHI